MVKTVKELREDLSNLLNGIIQANSSFDIVNLSKKALEVTKGIKELEEAQKSKLEPKPEPKPEPKKVFGDIKFNIPFSAVLISEENRYGKERFIRFARINTLKSSGYEYAGEFCIEILKNLFETTPEAKNSDIEKELIQILEEKFGLTIKICGNCKYYKPEKALRDGSSRPYGGCIVADKLIKFPHFGSVRFDGICSDIHSQKNYWAPKEIPPEKKEEEKTCGNCGNYYYYDGSCDQLGGNINRQRRLGDFCCFFPSKWIPKEIPEEKK